MTRLWSDLRLAAHGAMREPGTVFTARCGIQYVFDTKAHDPVLICVLLNGKEIFYHRPTLETDPKFDKPVIYYHSVKDHGWRQDKAWHGVLTENAVSGLARELLCDAMLGLEAQGYHVILSVHDELVVEGREFPADLMREIMATPPAWAQKIGVPIAVDAWTGERYRK